MTFFPERVSAVVFDIGGVFLYPDYQGVAGRLIELEVEPPADIEEYRRAHHAGVHALAVAANPTREHDPSFWVTYDHAYGRSLGVPDELLPDLEIAVRQGWDWAHQLNIDAFHRLVEAGMPRAIVSNNNGTAPDQMMRHGVCQVLPGGPLPQVSAIIDSALVGVAKPDPIIMVPAIYALGLPADEILYVGDTVQADVAAATAAGMQVVQLDPFDHHAEWDTQPGGGHTRLPDVASILQQLGLG